MTAISSAGTPSPLPGSSFSGRALVAVPMVAASLCFLVAPLLVILVNSLTVSMAGGVSFSLSNYAKVLTDRFYWDVLLKTVRISLITTVATLLLGYPAALYLYFSESRWRSVLLFIIVSPLFISVVVRTYGWIVLLGNEGAINSLLPPDWRMRLLRTEGAIVLGLMHIYIPFMVLSLNAALVKVDRKLLSAAASLGASNLQMFRDILWPLSVPGILSGCMIVFAISMTAFSTPVLLGGAANKTMPYLIYQQNLLLSNWHLGSALAFVLLAATLLGVAFLRQLAERSAKRSMV
jgi:putative spermidine/putrescine transport system permease protein